MNTEITSVKPIIVVHGGAGVIAKETPPEKAEHYQRGLQASLEKGFAILQKNGTAVDAVAAAVVELEDNTSFNAGRGAVYTEKATHEMDASIMDGRNLDFGGVCTVKKVKHPVNLAKEVLSHSSHLIFSGSGAEKFAKERNIDLVTNEYFDDEFRYNQLVKARSEGIVARDHDIDVTDNEKPMGTVGAVAIDMNGNLAAATSTGGTTNKQCGRVGDTPVPGAGTYADNRTCAVSCTGYGEEFLKKCVAYDLHARILYKGISLQQAAEEVVWQYMEKGTGGLIAVDKNGNITLPFNTPGMLRGYKRTAEDWRVKIW